MGNTTWELLYSSIKPKPVKYVRSVVSYLDILGFRNLIDTKTAGEISRILRILAESVDPGISKSERIRATKFSDTVIRTAPATPDNLVFELRSILHAQLALIPEGILIRGAVTIGRVVQSWGRVYGPAVIKAYDLERVKDAPPRIVVDSDIFAALKTNAEKEGVSSELDYLLAKEGSMSYLDYLRVCERELNVPEQEYPIFLEIHRDFIRQGLTNYASNASILQKFEWLSSYHDRTVDEYFESSACLSTEVASRFKVHG